MRDIFTKVMTGSMIAGAALLVAACGGSGGNNTAANNNMAEPLPGSELPADNGINGVDSGNLGTGTGTGTDLGANNAAGTDTGAAGGNNAAAE